MNGNETKKEFGDYQTPKEFAEEVCRYIKAEHIIDPQYILEPTVGVGGFVSAALSVFPDVERVYGVEINNDYCKICRDNIPDEKVTIICDNYFSFDTSTIFNGEGSTLVVGNPPWATNSELNFNLPEKVNFKRLSGTDAITGASNFDICEYIILKLIGEFSNTDTLIAMLCKTSVARNVFQEINRNSTNVSFVRMLNFNSSKVFGINAAACLLLVKLSSENVCRDRCEVFDISDYSNRIGTIICKNGILSSAESKVDDFDGECCFTWRQGVKHDCASIMELVKKSDCSYENKRKESVELEDTYVFPLMKSSSFKEVIINQGFKKHVIVTQKKAREETNHIEKDAPLTWRYLSQNKELFDGRKSSIYNGAPAFSMFGVGDYSYSEYKVGISGFYKKPVFSLLYNKDMIEKPIMLDDTSYFLSFEDYDVAYTCMVLLNNSRVQEFLYSISFQDAKRPYTKKVLQRLNLKKCLSDIDFEELVETEKQLKLNPYLQETMVEKLKNMVV